jgi:hypothetical protein
LDYQILRHIRSEELLGQAWMKSDKERRAAHVNMASTRFNAVRHLSPQYTVTQNLSKMESILDSVC